jgi:hypothetical protein
MASVPSQEDTVVSHHDPRDEAVGHANAHAVPFQGSTDLGRGIGTRLVEWKTRQGGEELASFSSRAVFAPASNSKRVITVVRS